MLIPGGAHVEQLKKGDIIFNHKQTEELIKYGRVASGGGHGLMAHADGTAHNMMNAFSGAIGGGWSGGKGGQNVYDPYNYSGATTEAAQEVADTGQEVAQALSDNTGATQEATKYEAHLTDWIEVWLNTFARKVE